MTAAERHQVATKAAKARWGPELALLIFQSIAVGNRFEFHANSVGDGDHWASFESEGRQHRTELMHFERVVTFYQPKPAPITDADDERLDFEIGGRFPRAEDLQIRFFAFSYSMGVPCGRSFQVIMYFMILLLSHFGTICPPRLCGHDSAPLRSVIQGAAI
jgi:hypothetical protein